MSDSIEATGGLVDAALVAAAVDGDGGNINAAEAAHVHHRCANCGAGLNGNFCGNCGQKAHVHRSLLHVGEEFLHGITHFDGKAWKTLPMLVFRPGKLTRDYIEGRRARYIAPVPLFLLVVFLMFFVFSFVHIKGNTGGGAADDNGKLMTEAQAREALPKLEAELAKIEADIKKVKTPGPGELAALKGVRAGIVATRDQVKARAAGEVESPLDIPSQLAKEMRDGDLGSETLNRKAKLALNNPELVLYKIQGKAYKLSFLLVPLSLPWLWLMFVWKRGVRMYDHAVFALYSISFMSLLFVIGSAALTFNIVSAWLWVPLVLAPPVHMYAQLKGTYALSRFSATWRTFGLLLASIITVSLYGLLMIGLGVLD